MINLEFHAISDYKNMLNLIRIVKMLSLAYHFGQMSHMPFSRVAMDHYCSSLDPRKMSHAVTSNFTVHKWELHIVQIF